MDISESIQLAFQYYQSGNLHEAKHTCTEILKEQPNNEAILYLLGIVHAQLEEYDSAVQHLKKSLQFNSNNADAYLALGAIFQKNEMSDEAINFYRKAIVIDSDFAEAYENLGDIFREKHQLDEAITHYKRAIQLNPNAAEIYLNLGNIFKEKGQYDLVTFYYRTALRYKPDYAEVYNNLGIIFHEQKRLDEAINYYQKALQFNPNLTDAYVNLEHASEQKRQFNEAMNKYQHRLAVTIKLRFIEIELMINAVINQFYFRTLNIQFHPDTLRDENFTTGLKSQIMENILSEIKEIDNINKFLSDLERLNTIRNYFANPHLETMSLQKNKGAITNYKKNDRVTYLEKLHHEFILTAARIEAQLVQVLNS